MEDHLVGDHKGKLTNEKTVSPTDRRGKQRRIKELANRQSGQAGLLDSWGKKYKATCAEKKQQTGRWYNI